MVSRECTSDVLPVVVVRGGLEEALQGGGQPPARVGAAVPEGLLDQCDQHRPLGGQPVRLRTAAKIGGVPLDRAGCLDGLSRGLGARRPRLNAW